MYVQGFRMIKVLGEKIYSGGRQTCVEKLLSCFKNSRGTRIIL
jgi:hypothetical protein